MSTLYQIIKSLQSASGSNAKQAVLEAHKDNELLKAYLKATYDPALSYYQKKAPVVSAGNMATLDADFIEWVVDNLAGRKVTGNNAISTLKQAMACMDVEGQELTKLLIARSVGAGVGDTMILKTFPGLWFSVPYQRCSLLDDKAIAKFSKLPLMYVQPKLDGSFMYLVKEAGKPPQAITRAGSVYPQWFADKLAMGLPDGLVLVGEALVMDVVTGKPLPRQQGNGLLNSVLKGDDTKANLNFTLTCWDLLSTDEFRAGFSEDPYIDRLSGLQYLCDFIEVPSVQCVDNTPVKCIDEAFKIYTGYTEQGMEGAVLKNPGSMWKNGTSKDMVKLKIAFEAEYVVTDIYEGEGKAKGMLGGITVETSDGLLKCNCGTGYSDALRKEYWNNPHKIVGGIVTIIANDVISNRDSNTKSLFLPVFSEVRFDKTEADSLARVMEQFNAAKSGGK
jgi:DNA ligase-1